VAGPPPIKPVTLNCSEEKRRKRLAAYGKQSRMTFSCKKFKTLYLNYSEADLARFIRSLQRLRDDLEKSNADWLDSIRGRLKVLTDMLAHDREVPRRFTSAQLRGTAVKFILGVTDVDGKKSHGRPALLESPGVVYIEYGKNYDGYWTFDRFAEQVVGIIDVMEVVYPQMQLAFEVDNSSNHLKKREDGLDVIDMNLKWGGAKKKMHATTITAGCLGDSPGSSPDQPKYHTVRKLQGKKAEGVSGYVGECKVLLQVLYERGLYVPRMKGRESMSVQRKKICAGKAPIDPELDAHCALSRCADFVEEGNALQDLVEARAHTNHLRKISPGAGGLRHRVQLREVEVGVSQKKEVSNKRANLLCHVQASL
jgi:hypothetical protein